MGELSLNDKMQVVSAWHSSGQSQEDFCRDHPAGVAPRTLRAWVKMLRRPDDVWPERDSFWPRRSRTVTR